MNQNDEDILVDLARRGDMEAFEQLVARYESRVFTIAYRFTGNYDDASDLAQEAFIRVYRSISSFRGESSLLTWLTRVVTNVCKDELRRRAKQKVVSIEEMTEKGQVSEPESRQKTLEEAVLKKEWQEEVQQILNSLTYEHRAVIIMRDVQGYSYEEIAGFLECSLGTVKSRINRARQILKNKLLTRNELLIGQAGHGH
ncbi:MAG TPA: sigma-70 family RNA polymerase sigma factor [Desulfobacteria bacterium]|nr:sigma-70 family RNA polymerase sigma factor [Desulfobacteria bacterium]